MSPSTQLTDMRLTIHLRRAWQLLAQTGRLVVGIPDYDLYLAHMQQLHPENEPMTREEFFGERMQARYGRGASRCC